MLYINIETIIRKVASSDNRMRIYKTRNSHSYPISNATTNRIFDYDSKEILQH